MEPNFYNKYHITKCGKIISLTRNKELSPANHKGYLRVTLFENGKRNYWSVHRLVATVYIDNPDNKPCVNHKDGNKHNNDISNLEWVTYSENERHSHDVLGKEVLKGESVYNHKLTEEDVRYMRSFIRNKTNIEYLAEKFKVSIWSVRDVIYYRRWNHVK